MLETHQNLTKTFKRKVSNIIHIEINIHKTIVERFVYFWFSIMRVVDSMNLKLIIFKVRLPRNKSPHILICHKLLSARCLYLARHKCAVSSE